MQTITSHSILSFWFAQENRARWFKGDSSFDAEITQRFAKVYEEAKTGALSDWRRESQSALALVIALDQFPRNMFRGSSQAFATDEQALSIAKESIASKFDEKLNDDERQFLYMPFMHSENLVEQEHGMSLFSSLGDPNAMEYMRRHRDIIARFGRFPHRNAVLGRKTTAEEAAFLTQPDSSF